MKTFTHIFRLLLASCACLTVTTGWSKTEVNVQTAGTLSSLISTSEKELKVTGFINGSDIKFIRQLITSGKVTILDWSEVSIVAGGDAYYENYTTSDNTIGEKMFCECSGLKQMTLPSTLRKIQGDAFKQTGLTSIDIPSSVREILNSAFCYCNSLSTVIIGEHVTTIDAGLFWGSAVKEVYVQPLTPPSVSDYLFGSNPTIHVYASALEAYQSSRWAEYGTIVGDLTDDIIDGIEEVKNEKLKVKNDETIYDLSGRKINSSMVNGQSSMFNGLKPGSIYIRNGKKILFGKH